MKQQLLNYFIVVRHVLSLVVVTLLPLGVWAQTDFGITVGGVAVTSANASGVTGDNITGTVTYSADDNSLTLSGATITGNIVITSGTALNIKVSGQNVINAGSVSAVKSEVVETSASLSFTKVGTGDCSLELNSEGVTVISTGFSTPTYNVLALVVEGVDYPDYYSLYGWAYYDSQSQANVPITSATITSYTTYDIVVNGEAVTNLNKDKICKGTVGAGHILFDGEHTLTLNNVPGMVFDGTYPFIQTSMDLTINLVGTSSFDCGQSFFITRRKGDNDTHTVTFTTSATDPGMLTLQVGDQFDGFEKAFENGLEWMPAGYYDTSDPYAPVAWVAPPYVYYGITVGDVAVISTNANNILGENYEGKASYNVSNNTLTLENLELPMGITSSLDNLTIKLSGTNSLYTESPESVIKYNGNGAGSLSIVKDEKSQGSLNLICYQEGYTVISGFTSVSYAEFNISSESTGVKYDTNSKQLVDAQGAPVESAQFTLTKLYIGNTPVTEANADDVLGDGGTVKFISTGGQTAAPVYTLTLNGATITGPIKVGLDNLTLDVQGTNTITANGSCVILSELEGSTLTFKSTSDGESNLTMTNDDKESYDGVFSGGFSYNIDKTLALVQPNTTYYFTDGSYHTVRFASAYGVGISDGGGGVIQVYSGNADDVLGDGKVSFNKKNHTLTLNNAKIGGISTSLSALDIDVIGNNSITMSGNGAVFQNPYGVANIEITVKSTAETTGCLSMYLSYNDNSNNGGTSGFLDTNVTLAYSNGLTLVSGNLTDTYNAYAMIAEPVDYDLYVDNIKVVAANASNITNDLNNNGNPYASFDAETNTLTLDNISTSYYWSDNILVQSDIRDLTIKLVGNNTVTLGNKKYAVEFIGKAPDAAPTLTFDSEVENNQYGSLTITGTSSPDAIADGYQITNTLADDTEASGLVCTIGDNYVKLWSQESYGLVVIKDAVSYSINNANCSDVLSDGTDAKPASVQYDGHSRLVLTNADVTEIILHDNSHLPIVDAQNKRRGLELYLRGTNTIQNNIPSGIAVSSEDADNKTILTFLTDVDDPGSLTYYYTDNPFGILKTENVFSNFEPVYKVNLAPAASAESLTVQIPLNPVIDPVDPETDINYVDDPSKGSTDIALNNDVYGDVLYTMNDDGTKDSPDGYDQNRQCLVFNTPMTDDQVNAINTNETVPCTPAYAHVFRGGMTFVVPASAGSIGLDIVNLPDYAFHVKVGNQPAVEVSNPVSSIAETGLSAFRRKTVSYACSEPSYVKIYLVRKSASATAPAFGSHRAGPKASISGGIGGMKVSAGMISSTPDASAAYYQMGKGDWERKAGTKGIVVNNADVTDLPDNAFDTSSPAPGLNRAPATDEITFIDLTATKVTGKSYDRTTGAFAGIPASTLIYLPAGNTATGKNFVIGGICDDMQLDGTSDNTFEVSKKFTASQAAFERDFEAGENKCYTVYLPYSIDTEKVKGNFFEYDGFDAEKQVVKMKAATGLLVPNKAYIFSPSATGGIEPMHCVDVEVPGTSVSAPADDAEAEGLYGVYEYYQWTSAPSNIYCYAAADKDDIKAGQFAKVGAGEDIKPFCAYLRINAATNPSSVIIDWGNGATSIVPLDKQQVEQGPDGWYTITGLRLPEKPSQKGVYIHQGKKVAVK